MEKMMGEFLHDLLNAIGSEKEVPCEWSDKIEGLVDEMLGQVSKGVLGELDDHELLHELYETFPYKFDVIDVSIPVAVMQSLVAVQCMTMVLLRDARRELAEVWGMYEQKATEKE